MVRVTSPTFVGRAAELAALDEAFDAAAGGRRRPSSSAVTPASGSHASSMSGTGARARGARLAVGSCVVLGQTGAAYAAVIEVLRDLLGGLDPTENSGSSAGTDPLSLALFRSWLLLAGPAPCSADAPQLAQARLFNRLVGVIQRMASRPGRVRARGHPLGRSVDSRLPPIPGARFRATPAHGHRNLRPEDADRIRLSSVLRRCCDARGSRDRHVASTRISS